MDDNAPTIESQSFDRDQIMAMIPHRPPFLLIDEVVQVITDKSAVGIKNIDADEYYFAGHFPGHPIMPGVLIIEAMAQTSAVLVIASAGKTDNAVVYFMSVEQARFRKPVFPEERLELHVDKLHSRGNVWKFKGRALVDGQLRAEATYAAMIVETK